MSIIVAAVPSSADGGRMEVALATTRDELRAVQRLRKRIYVDELGIVDPSHPYVDGDLLRDDYDRWSSNLLLRKDGEAIGTVRITELIDGPMELAEYADVVPHLPDGARPAELTRFMVAAPHRRGQAGPLLLYAAFRVIANSRSTHLVAASKLGSLSSYYRYVGLRLLHDEPFTYGLTGGQYQLGAMDLGAPSSARRLALAAWFGTWKVLGSYASPFAHVLFRRRLRPKGASPVGDAVAASARRSEVRS